MINKLFAGSSNSFAALLFGVSLERIALLPIGDVAQIKRIPENPSQELIIPIAGPAVNFVLADGHFVGLIPSRDISEVDNLISVDPDLLARADVETTPAAR